MIWGKNFRIVDKKVLTLPELMRAVLKHIYEPQNMSLNEIENMQRSVIAWSRKVKPNEIEVEAIERIGWMLQRDQEGLFDERKRLFKEKGIDYRKFHRLPEAYSMKDFETGLRLVREWNEKNPELAG